MTLQRSMRPLAALLAVLGLALASPAVPGRAAETVAATSSEELAATLRQRLVEGIAAQRAVFLARVNEARTRRHLPPLRLDRSLDTAAQAHADELLAALRAGRDTGSVATLASRITDRWHPPRVLSVGSPGSGALRTDRTDLNAPPRLAVGESLVTDALSAEEAADTAAAADASALLVSGYARLGLGVALVTDGGPPHVVWVACLLPAR